MGVDVATRIHRLAARVRWTDRFRRPISVVFAAIVAPLTLYQLRVALEADWPLVATILPCVVWASVIWWATEASFAFVVALWETEHDRLTRSIGRALGLPPARLLRRPRRTRRTRRPE